MHSVPWPLLRVHLQLPFLAAVLAFAPATRGGGIITNCTQTELQAALIGGGNVSFACGGTLTLTNTIVITQDTTLDASGFAVTLSGGNAVRLFQVNSNVAFSLNGLTLSGGRVIGANGTNGTPSTPGHDCFGAGILNLGGTVALTDCTLQGHVAQGGDSGSDPNNYTFASGGSGMGAALCNLGGALNLTNCLLKTNSTLGGRSLPPQAWWMGQPGEPMAGKALGAAIYSANGQVRCQAVTFTSCSVLGGPLEVDLWGGAHQEEFGTAGGGLGGAIYATNSQVLLASSALTNNTAAGGSDVGFGGALFLDQGCSGVIRLCLFSGNAANGAPGWVYTPSANAAGGAIFNGGELEIRDSTFLTNSCAGGGFSEFPGSAGGGAIWSTNGLTINRSTFNANQATGGAGVVYALFLAAQGAGGAVWSSGALMATNCTASGNTAQGGNGGDSGWGAGPAGAGLGGAICVAGGQAVLVNVTIAGNRAYTGTWDQVGEPLQPIRPSQGGGICNTNGTVLVLNSIVANSGATNGGDVWGVVTDSGYNICSDGSASFSAATSQNQADPMLGPLADNGGPTQTMALLPGSPAIDGIPSGFPPTDQRGVLRPQGRLADIGAFECLVASPGTSPTLAITFQPSSSVAITFAGLPGNSYFIEASQDLAQWTQIGTAAAGANGQFEFIDTNAEASRARYYRTRTP